MPNVVPNYSPLIIDKPEDIIKNVWYFKNWLVGFVTAEGSCSFFVQANKEIAFSISQKTNKTLIEGIHLFFKQSRLSISQKIMM